MIDILLAGLLILGFVVGFFRGAVRQLLVLGVWLVAFLIGAHARPFVGEFLGSQWVEHSPVYIGMLSFGIVFTLVYGIGLVAAEVTGSRVTLTRQDWVDDLLGGLLGVGVALLTIAAALVILSTAYETPRGPGSDVQVLRDTYVGLTSSFIGARLNESLVSGLGALLGPLLPADVRLVMA